MTIANHLAVAFGAESDVVTRLGPIRRDAKALIARGDELDRAIALPSRERDERRARRHVTSGPECATHVVAHHADFVRIDAEPLGNAVLEPIDELARLMHGELVTRPHAGRS